MPWISRFCKTYAVVVMTIVLFTSLALFFGALFKLGPNIANEPTTPFGYLGMFLLSVAFFINNQESAGGRTLSGFLALVASMISVAAIALKINGGAFEGQQSTLTVLPYLSIINLLFVGWAVLFQNTSRLFFMGQTLFFLGFCLALSVLIGFFEGMYYHHFISQTPYTTALLSVGWLLICSGYLLNTPNNGLAGLLFSPSSGGKIFRRLLPAVVVIPVVLSWLAMILRVEFNISVPIETEIFGLITLLVLALITWAICYWIGETHDSCVELATLVDATDTAFFRQDLNGMILTWSNGAQKTFGYTPHEAIGRHLALLYAEDNREESTTLLEKVCKGKSVIEANIPMCSKTGKRFDAALTAIPLKDKSNHYIGSSVLVRDITQTLRYTSMMEARKQELENKSRELEKANHELEQFTVSVSHDLQEPLRKIKNYGNLIQEKKDQLDPEVANYVDRMVGGVERLHTFTNALLELAKVRKKEIHKQPLDLNHTIKQVLDELDLIVRKKQAVVKVEILPQVEADPNQMHALFANLISNALKYNKKDTVPHVVVQGEKGDHYVRIMIQDNGIGIPAKYKDKIFNPFFRVDGEKPLAGAGMGLSICQKIVERHHGKIYAESSEDLGTIMIVELPSMQEPEERVDL